MVTDHIRNLIEKRGCKDNKPARSDAAAARARGRLARPNQLDRLPATPFMKLACSAPSLDSF